MKRTVELIARSQSGDKAASEALLIENTGLIWSVTRRFLGRGVDADDLYQLGCLGFLKAVAGFNLEFGTQFSTYAVPKIAGEIRRFLRDDGAVKVSRSIKERAFTIRTVRNRLLQTLEREPTIQEISEHTGFSIEEIATAENATASVESMQQASGDDGFTLENILTDTKTEESFIEKISLKQAIDRLTQKEKAVIQLRYFHGLTQQRVSVVLGVSQVQISRLEKKAIHRLKELME